MYFPGWRSFWWRYIAGPAAVVVFVALIALMIPALSAHDGHGEHGRWTATNVLCSHNRCNEVGTFLSTDGADRRTRISMFGSPDLAIGQAIPAVDTGGDEVYPPGGGDAWWHDLIGVIAAGLASAVWLWACPIRALRQRRLKHADAVVFSQQLYHPLFHPRVFVAAAGEFHRGRPDTRRPPGPCGPHGRRGG